MNSISPTPTQDQQHIGGGLESVNLALLNQSPGPLSSEHESRQGAELCQDLRLKSCLYWQLAVNILLGH